MQPSHTLPVASATFDEPNLVSPAGLVPIMHLAENVNLAGLADQHLTVPTDKGSNAGAKVTALVGGMIAGADSIDDMALLRHGAMKKLFDGCYAPSTLGSFLRSFTFGHVRQLDAVASRVLIGLNQHTPLLAGLDERAIVDIDDSIIEVHGHQKQGAGFGYSGVRGLNSFIATVSTDQAAPVIVAQRLRKGAVGSPRGAKRLVTDTLATVARMRSANAAGKVLLRADSAFMGHPTISAAITAGADVSVTVRLNADVKRAIAAIDEGAWTTIKYPQAIWDEDTRRWISKAQVAEIGFTAFSAQRKANHVPGRLIVRRIPDVNADKKKTAGQGTLFDVWRFHAFFTTVPETATDTVAMDQLHRQHAIIENVHADLKDSAIAHMPSGFFTANAAWLVLAVIAFNLTRAAGTLTGDTSLAKATTGTLRRTIINVPARIASSARKLAMHLPNEWPWQHPWEVLHAAALSPPRACTA
ncbi:IS1380 family transposase [Leekyejoonella antrihumi]|uniref:IS1380 family transposase n=1 Tax=Leekyejoonella antrihumi TaxID=1660198 RepID=A0A563DWK6_9MICO|nr:IS1380 family transposase [Leekyejoonella antrihumi]TWP34351.1 IS1380 family transposase [Leekyejoonella antrihumi]